MAQLVKNLPAMQETPVLIPGLGRFPWRREWPVFWPEYWTEEPGGLLSLG